MHNNIVYVQHVQKVTPGNLCVIIMLCKSVYIAILIAFSIFNEKRNTLPTGNDKNDIIAA